MPAVYYCSVLEPGRTLTLAERGGEGAEVVVAAPGFRLLATMNPGGDFGKKELSPALANRFTTVWVPAMEDLKEMRAILEARLTGESVPSHALKLAAKPSCKELDSMASWVREY